MEYSTQFYVIFVTATAVAGVVAGLIAGLLGVGGGLVLVPVLFYLFHQMGVDPSVALHVAIGTSLATIIATAISSSRAHYKKGGVDTELLKHWAPWLIVGALIAMSLFSSIKSAELGIIFSVMTFSIAMYMLFGSSRKNAENSVGNFPQGPIRWISGLLVAGLSTIMGIGGGSLTVPLLSYFKYPMRKAVGTSAAVGLLISLPGAAGAVLAGLGQPNLPPFSFGYVNIVAFAILIPITAFVAPYGARLAHSANPRYLRYAFAAFLLFNACNMLYTALTT